MKLSVIIVNYNVKHYVYQCLESLRRAAQSMEWEVFVVDNNSTDDSVKYLEEAYANIDFPQLHIIANHDNPGFGRANNQAFAKATGEYILYLNPDTFVGESVLEDCIKFMQQHPQIGCLGVKMHNSDGAFAIESRRCVPTPWVSFCKITRLATLFPKSRRFGRYYLQHLPIDEPAPIDMVSGAFMFARRDVLEEVGTFDEDYFMYCEDFDLSYRMLLSGRKNYYLPTPILHYKGESTKRLSYSYVNTFYKAILIFYRKHFRRHISLLTVFIYLAIYLLAILSFIRGQILTLRYNIKNKLAPKRFSLLCLVKEENSQLIQDIQSRYDIDADICTQDNITLADIEELTRSRCYDYIVYDTERYGYKELLAISNTLTKKPYIGTLYPQRRMILTNLHIYLA